MIRFTAKNERPSGLERILADASMVLALRGRDMGTCYETLKTRQRQERDDYPEDLSLRVHRALSLLDRAEQESDPDSRFIFLWIAFNAAYASEIDDRQGLSEQATFNAFLEKLHTLDKSQRLKKLVWKVYSGAISALLDNPYVVRVFWEYQKGNMSQPEWERRFAGAKHAARKSISSHNTPKVLSIALDRIYVLRNQLIHGGATWGGQVNRNQIADCIKIMNDLVPVVIEIMMDNPRAMWGQASFPVVKAG